MFSVLVAEIRIICYNNYASYEGMKEEHCCQAFRQKIHQDILKEC